MKTFVVALGLILAVSAFAPVDNERLYVRPQTGATSQFFNRGLHLEAHNEDPATVSLRHAQRLAGNLDVVLKDQYTTKDIGVMHSYYRQVINGLEVLNADIGVNTEMSGRIVNVWETAYHGSAKGLTSARPTLSPEDALRHFAAFAKRDLVSVQRLQMSAMSEHYPRATMLSTPLSEDDVPATLAYVHNATGLYLVWDMVVNAGDAWWNAAVDAHTGEVLSVVDWVHDDHVEPEYAATYRGYLPPVTDPTFYDKERTVEKERFDESAPLGWQSIVPGLRLRTTVGNMGCAQGNLQPSSARNCGGGDEWTRPIGGSDPDVKLDFDFPVDLNAVPETYIDASVTNLFWWANFLHDVFWYYGFTEPAGNFQENNLERGGRENDGVQNNAQDASGFNNANFATPPDGQRPRMRMYLWTGTPQRDGDFDGAIVTHEYGHGISIRLTGGPSNVNCLGGGQSGGMGEGWGDFWGVTLGLKADSDGATPTPMGAWAADRPGGIRPYPYSTDMSVNPQTYGLVGTSGYTGVHAIGSIWAQILLDVYFEMVALQGFDPDWFPEEEPVANDDDVPGNHAMWHIVVDALKIQPCSPNFIDARDAILAADDVRYNSVHKCLIWKAFARRGVGTDAKSSGSTRVTEGFEVPAECK